jgi:integrase/recombinase XerD
MHTESDLRAFPTWCHERHLDPLAAQRAHIERYVRWVQDVPRFKPSTVSRRIAVVAGFFRTASSTPGSPTHPRSTCADPTSRPSPRRGATHLRSEAMLVTAPLSANPDDFALVAMLGLLGLRMVEASGADIEDLGEEHGHRVVRVRGKGGKVVPKPFPPALARSTDRAVDQRDTGPILRTRRGSRMDRHCATAMCRSPRGTRTRERRCVTTAPARTSTGTQLHPRRLHGLRHLAPPKSTLVPMTALAPQPPEVGGGSRRRHTGVADV